MHTAAKIVGLFFVALAVIAIGTSFVAGYMAAWADEPVSGKLASTGAISFMGFIFFGVLGALITGYGFFDRPEGK